MNKFTKICKWCNNVFETKKEDKEYCCHNHKKQHFNKLNAKPKKELTCIICQKTFYSNRKNAECCSRKCTTVNANLKIREQRRIENNKKYEHVSDIPTCKICGWKSRSLQNHLTCHNMTIAEYKLKYNATSSDIFHSSFTEEKSQRVSGEKNPGYQHNGTMSSFSKKFKKYDDLTESETEEAIQKQIKKANKIKKNNNSYNTTLDFYIKKGYTLEESKILLKERQSTFSLEKCIDKYGEEEGKQIFIKRQKKWQTSLAKQFKLGYSKISQELFDSIIQRGFMHKCYYATNGDAGKNNEYILKLESSIVKPDFFVPGLMKIIEFDGDYWHSDKNPNNICSEQRDSRILNKYPMCKILHIYEKDYRKNPEGIINKCLTFLNNE